MNQKINILATDNFKKSFKTIKFDNGIIKFNKKDKVYYCRPDLNDFTASKGVIDRIEGENAFLEGIPIDVLQHIVEEVIDIQPLKKDYRFGTFSCC